MLIALVVGFLLFHIVEKLIVIHHAHESDYADHFHPQVGVLSALALAGHSFMDGLGIGLGFQVSTKVGIFMAVAVIAGAARSGVRACCFAALRSRSMSASNALNLSG